MRRRPGSRAALRPAAVLAPLVLVPLLVAAACSDGDTLEDIVADGGGLATTTSVPGGTSPAPSSTLPGGPGTTSAAPVEGEPVSVFDLQVRDCFDDPVEGDAVDEVLVVPCDRPHANEVFALFELADGAYPGQARVTELAEQGCIERFEDYVGRDYPSSALEIAYLYPLEREWDELGDRGVACIAYRLDLQPLTATVEGSGL